MLRYWRGVGGEVVKGQRSKSKSFVTLSGKSLGATLGS